VAALAFLICFVLLLSTTIGLEKTSVWTFNPTHEWLVKQYGDAKTNPDEKLADFHLPDFINLEQQKFYFPPQVDNDPELKNYLLVLGKNDLRTGIRNAMDREPIRLIDWAETKGKDIRQRYNNWFAILHFCMIFCAAGAWGSFRNHKEFILEPIFNLFGFGK
jgi:hypothetical protein